MTVKIDWIFLVPQMTKVWPHLRRNISKTRSAKLGSSENLFMSCTFSKQSYPGVSCGTVTDMSARRNLLKQQGRCVVCLRRNHLAKTCSPNKMCRIFSRRHHMSICKMCTVAVVPVCWCPEKGERNSNENKSSTIVYPDSNTPLLSQTALAQVSRVHQLSVLTLC